MAKYSYELKKKIVEEYLSGKRGYPVLEDKYQVGEPQIRRRVNNEDGKILYRRKVFTSERELKKQVQKHEDLYNRTAKTSLDFKSPNQVGEEYFSRCNICLDS